MIEHMIERQEDPTVLKRIEMRARTKQTNKKLNETIRDHGGTKEGRQNIYATVAGRNNEAVYERTAKEIKQAHGVRNTRDALDTTRLSLMATAEELEAVNIPRRNAWGNHQILEAVDEVCDDIEGLRQKYGPSDPLKYHWLAHRALACSMLGHWDEALENAADSVHRTGSRVGWATYAAALARAGQLEEAGKAWRELAERTPGVSAAALGTFLGDIAIDEVTANSVVEDLARASEAASSATR